MSVVGGVVRTDLEPVLATGEPVPGDLGPRRFREVRRGSCRQDTRCTLILTELTRRI